MNYSWSTLSPIHFASFESFKDLKFLLLPKKKDFVRVRDCKRIDSELDIITYSEL